MRTFRYAREADRGLPPAIIISVIVIVGEAIDERHLKSFPIISIDMNMSLRFPAIVISWTG